MNLLLSKLLQLNLLANNQNNLIVLLLVIGEPYSSKYNAIFFFKLLYSLGLKFGTGYHYEGKIKCINAQNSCYDLWLKSL